MLSAVRAVAGVSDAAVVTGMPLHFFSNGMQFTLVGGPTYADPSQRPDTGFQSVSPGYFKTFGVQGHPRALRSPTRTRQPAFVSQW